MLKTKTYRPEEIRDPETGKWINSKVFCEEGIKFMKNGYYCPDPIGSPSYKEYWDEQLRRFKEGYEVAGHKITGHHYEYLNFTQIQIVKEEEDSPTSVKETKMPDFWDGDFDYYWSLEIAKNGVANSASLLTTKLEKEVWKLLPAQDQKNHWIAKVDSLKLNVKPHPDFLGGGNHMIVGKSRRKGYSYKNAAICANVYNTIRKSLTVIGAFDKKYLYPKGTMGMASDYLSFLNKHTAFFKARDFVDKQEHRKASFKETIGGVPVESGYQSEIVALTFMDNPDAARGKDAVYVLLEEAGVFPNLEASYKATQPSLEAGRYITGQILIFGTGGDMEVGTKDFANMFYNPIQFRLMPFINIWDKDAYNSYCGFFHPVYMNLEGFYDEQGNSDKEAAIAYEESVRDNIKKNSTSTLVLQSRVQEYPLCPSEAFLTVSINDFPTVELRNRFNIVTRDKLHTRLGQPVFLEYIKEKITLDNGEVKTVNKVRAKPDLDGILEPIWDYNPKTKDLRGAVVIFEYPTEHPPKGLYKIGFDPYRQQNTVADRPSLASIWVYKVIQRGSHTSNTIVAKYKGRPYNPDDVNKIAMMLAELYNAEVMYENEVTHVKTYFENKKKLHLLAAQPDKVISKAIKESKVARTFGCHMNDKLKDAGEKYIKTWLLEVRDFDEHGDAVLNLDTINDPGFLEALILYNKKGNFDDVMAFMMVMFQVEEDEDEKEYAVQTTETSNEQDLLEMMKNQFRKPSNFNYSAN